MLCFSAFNECLLIYLGAFIPWDKINSIFTLPPCRQGPFLVSKIRGK
jgi:hypothetical protein